MPGRRAFLRRRHVAAGASHANRRPRVRIPASLLTVAVPACWNGTAAAPLPVLGPQAALRAGTACHRQTWGRVIAGTGTRAETASEPATLPPVPSSLSVVRVQVSADEGSPDVGRFCGVDRLQITCQRRSKNPSAATAKTSKNGLEITAGTRASRNAIYLGTNSVPAAQTCMDIQATPGVRKCPHMPRGVCLAEVQGTVTAIGLASWRR
jgi:hypothetical protein